MGKIDFDAAIDYSEQRISRLFTRRIGTIFDNEALLEIERREKVLSSIRLSLGDEDKDIVSPDVEILDSRGRRSPLYKPLYDIYRQAEAEVLNGGRNTAYRSFLKNIAGLDGDDLNAALKAFRSIRKEADRFSGDVYRNTAELYRRMLCADELDFLYADIFARLAAYIYLMESDIRFAGMPLEVEFLAHESEHVLVPDSSSDEVALFLVDCIISAIYHASTIMDWMRSSSSLARDYLSTFIEKGERFTTRMLSEKLSMSEEAVKQLFIVPAEASDGFLVATDSKGREEYVILRT